MCDPVSLGIGAATAAVGGGSSIFSFLGQNAAAKANTTAANLGYANTMNQIGQRESQIDQQQSENTVSALIDRVAAQGRISAAAASGGSDAATAGRAANAADFGAGRALSIEDVNSENQRVGVGNSIDNAFYARQSQENQVLPQSPIQLGLGLAKAALSGFSAGGGLQGLFGGASAGFGTASNGASALQGEMVG